MVSRPAMTGPAGTDDADTADPVADASDVFADIAPEFSTVHAGTLLADRFELLRPLAADELIHVWTAQDRQTGTQVVVDFLPASLSDAEREALIRLDHPNIIKIVGYGQLGQLHYLIRPRLDTPNLHELLLAQGPLDWQSAVELVIQIGLALEYAHQHGVLHRGLNPACIDYLPQGQVEVSNFGVVSAAAVHSITLGNAAVMRAVSYYAPELIKGQGADPRTDVYALGVILFEILTGRLPFTGQNPVAVALHHLQDRPIRPTALNHLIPPALEQVIMRCLEKSPELRHDSARSLVEELDACLVDPQGIEGPVTGSSDWDSPTTAIGLQRPDSDFGRLRKIMRTIDRRRWSRTRDTLLVALILFLAVIFFGSIFVWGYANVLPLFHQETVVDYKVGTYIGQSLKEVETLLKKDEIGYIVKYVATTVNEGLVVEQDPAPGVTILPASVKIILTVSGGQNMITLDNYKGKSYTEAVAALKKLGLTVSRSYEYSKVGKGKVIRTTPTAGEKVPVGSNISIVVSEGMPTVRMPDLVGLSWSAAKAQLRKLNLIMGPAVNVARDPVTYMSIPVPEGSRVIISQSIDPDTKIMPQTVVGLTYGASLDYQQSLHPTPTPSPTPKVTPTPRVSPTPGTDWTYPTSRRVTPTPRPTRGR